MVLICGKDSPLTIDQFHKNRCMEKSQIKDIIINRKYNKEKYKEIEVEKKSVSETSVNNSYLKVAEESQLKSSNAINLSGYNCKRR